MNKKTIYIIDTSAILSGKIIDLENEKIVTVHNIKQEINPPGNDYIQFQLLIEKGLVFNQPSKSSIERIEEESKKTGDFERISKIDTEILALALEYKNEGIYTPVILTDDYSIQNMANFLNIKFISISQKGITKRFKWIYRCQGCGKKFKDNIKICPICGSELKKKLNRRDNLR